MNIDLNQMSPDVAAQVQARQKRALSEGTYLQTVHAQLELRFITLQTC
jgi:hypothetical protein